MSNPMHAEPPMTLDVCTVYTGVVHRGIGYCADKKTSISRYSIPRLICPVDP
jgi:hypothetical protein